MRLRVALFLAATFLAAALALPALVGCSDDPGAFDCSIECDGCFLISPDPDSGGSRGCVCFDLVDPPDPPGGDPYCPV